MYTRHITPLLQEALADTPVVLLNGARQTGKSTLVQALAASEGRRYFTLDDHATLAAATGDPAGFIAGINGAVALDEVQRAPALFLAIKAAVDRDRKPGRFLLTGSANVMLLPDIADSLAGRMEVLSLWPLSSAELAGDAVTNLADWLFNGELDAMPILPCERAPLIDKLVAGGFPEANGGGLHGSTTTCKPSSTAMCVSWHGWSSSLKSPTCCNCWQTAVPIC
jgi:predicted AAA+ superfamily ATPase